MGASRFAIPRKCEIPPGACGVWQIPDLNIVIPLYKPKVNTPKEAQTIIDAPDSATYRNFGAGKIIEDHAGSQAGRGNWHIGEVLPDMLGFLVREDRTERYVCNRIARAIRHDTCFTVDNIGFWPRSATDILCVSCATKDGSEVYVAAFKYGGRMP